MVRGRGENVRSIVILGALDTKGAEVEFLATRIAGQGCRPVLLDVGTGGEPLVAPDIPAAAVAEAGGGDLAALRGAGDVQRLREVMARGAMTIIRRLLGEGGVDGVIGLGGASGTTLATQVMQALPFGLPKLVVSSAAAMPQYAARYFGSRDLIIMHSVVDLAGLNSLVRDVLARAAGAICGMAALAEGEELRQAGQKRLAMSEFGFSETCCREIRALLAGSGYELLCFHAQGIGDQSMEELIEEGFFAGVLDIVPASVSERLLGGNRAGPAGRLEAAGRQGVPQVVTPCGFDMLSCGPLERRENGDPLWMERRLDRRALFVPDRWRVQARTTADELRAVARLVAEKLNRGRGPVRFLVPLRGWSSLSEEGGPLYDPEADRAFLEELSPLLRPEIEVQELDLALNTPEFARAAVTALLEMLEEAAPAWQAGRTRHAGPG